MAERIQRQRTKGWRMPTDAVYVGRPSKWGNPYRIAAARFVVGPWGYDHFTEQGAERGVAVRLFREHVADGRPPYDELDPAELRGKDLVCWCPLVDSEGHPVPCHADVLLEIANATPDD